MVCAFKLIVFDIVFRETANALKLNVCANRIDRDKEIKSMQWNRRRTFGMEINHFLCVPFKPHKMNKPIKSKESTHLTLSPCVKIAWTFHRHIFTFVFILFFYTFLLTRSYFLGRPLFVCLPVFLSICPFAVALCIRNQMKSRNVTDGKAYRHTQTLIKSRSFLFN